MSVINLLSNPARVETPFIEVQIGDHTFGVRTSATQITFPNFIRSIQITKINGTVNRYTLTLDYPITSNESDPNFFEKVLSSVADTRKMYVTYGDLSTPTYIYKKEEVLITKVSSAFSASPVLTYVITGTSASSLGTVGNFTFPGYANEKPSTVLRDILYKYNNKYGLLELFPGMANRTKVESNALIPTNDMAVRIDAKVGISILEYLAYLVSIMKTSEVSKNSLIKKSLFSFTIIDDVTGEFDGVYFKIYEVGADTAYSQKIDTYTVDIGYPSQNIVTSFELDTDNSYSMLYKYNDKISTSSYAERIDDNGKLVQIYSPSIGSSKTQFISTEAQKSWWTKMTEFPVKASMTLKGLLRPAILMSYLKVNVLFYGRRHVSSGMYIITKQVDTIDSSGYRTALSLTRISGDTEYD